MIHELHEDIRRAYPLSGELGQRMGRGLGQHRLEPAGRQAMQTIIVVDEKHSGCESHAEDANRFGNRGR